LLPLLPRIQCDTLVLHAEGSACSSITAARAASAAIPNSRLRVFEGDLPERMEQVLAAIADFVDPAGPAPERAVEAAPQNAAGSTLEQPYLSQAGILHLVARGLSNREIANALVLSPRTVERHLENLYRKTGTRNRAEAAAHAASAGLLEPGPA
jgi:DNA-binding CsgD family transcriptional regulator